MEIESSEKIAMAPVYLSPDMFRHEPVLVRIVSGQFGAYRNLELKSRYVRLDGIIVEFEQLLADDHPFGVGQEMEIKVFLPFDADPLLLCGDIHSVARRVVGNRGLVFSIVCVRFKHLSSDQAQRLQAHDLIVQTVIGRHRPARLPITLSARMKHLGGAQLSEEESSITLRDISMTGAFVETSLQLSKGDTADVEFRLPFQEAPIALQGKVVWSGMKKFSGEGGARAGVGIHFEKASPEVRVALAKFCAKNTLFPML